MSKGRTDQERLENVQSDVYQLEQMISEKNFSISDLADFIPGFLHLNSAMDITLEYLSPNMENFFEKDLDEITIEGSAFQYSVVHPSSAEIVVPKLQNFIQNHDQNQVLAYFQYMRRNNDHDYQWFLSLSKIRDDDKTIFTISNPLQTFGELEKQLKRLLDENLFMKKNFHKFDRLTKREKQILKWIVKGETNKTIADQLFISILTVKTHRRNLLKKLETNKLTDLIKYAEFFGISL